MQFCTTIFSSMVSGIISFIVERIFFVNSTQKILKALLSGFFIQAAGLAYHHRAKCGVYHQGRLAALVSHHAPACIFLRLDAIRAKPVIPRRDIQHFVLMICNFFGIDDIHAFGVMCASRKRIFPLKS